MTTTERTVNDSKCPPCGKVFRMYGYMVAHYVKQHINPRYWGLA